MWLNDWLDFSWWEEYIKQDTLWNLRNELPTPKNILLNAPLMQDSIKSCWKEEVSFFIDFFGIGNYFQFKEKVSEIQKKHLLKEDGVLWGETLKIVYLENYIKTSEKLPKKIKYRLDIYEEIKQNYNWKKMTWDNREVNPVGIPKVFAKQTYYGAFWEWPREWAFIEEILFGKISPTISERWNFIEISKINIDWKKRNYLAFYKNWKLEIATFVSIGINDKEKRTLEKTYNISKVIVDIDHVSSEFPKETRGGSVMAYAINVDWWTWIHSSNEVDGEPHSHGCIRTPLYYLRKLYDEVKWKPLKVEIKNLY